MSGALEGIKVIDFTRRGPGPYCTMILGDLGADVIRLEERGARPPARGRAERRAAAFDALNRNKRSVILNLKNPEGRRILHRLCEDLDVFVEGFRPGVMKRLGATTTPCGPSTRGSCIVPSRVMARTAPTRSCPVMTSTITRLPAHSTC